MILTVTLPQGFERNIFRVVRKSNKFSSFLDKVELRTNHHRNHRRSMNFLVLRFQVAVMYKSQKHPSFNAIKSIETKYKALCL